MILLDTQVVVWIMLGSERLGSKAHETLAASEDMRVSAMVSWELTMLTDKGRITLSLPVARWMDRARMQLSLAEVPVSGAIGIDAGSLPGTIHGDPCDRIMIATARALGCPIITSDGKILDYAAAGHLQAIDARR